MYEIIKYITCYKCALRNANTENFQLNIIINIA